MSVVPFGVFAGSCLTCESVYKEASGAHVQGEMSACQRRKAVAFYFTHTFTHTLWVLNGIKQLDDNSPDGQTRNRASISLPCFLLSLAFQPLHLYQHILTHTSPIPADIYTNKYIFRSCSKAITNMAISLANKSKPQELP